MNEYILRISFLEKGFDKSVFPAVPKRYLLINYIAKNEHDCEERFLSSRIGEKFIDSTKYQVKAFKKSI